MKRSYNVFVDNGLYVLSYYLEKDIEDITYDDIENSIDFMSDKIEEFVACEKYSNLKSMCFQNSTLTQPNGKVTLQEKLKGFIEHKGDELCSLCGENKAKVKIDNKEYNIGRSYIPNSIANTFYNFSNNLQGANICPYCLVTTMYSILNCRVNIYAFLYNAISNEFMEDYTWEMQDENLRDIEIGAKKSKGEYGDIKALEDLISKNKVYDGHIEQYMFNNSKSQEIKVNNIKNSDLKLLINLQNEGLLSEFKSMKLVNYILNGKLSSSYIFKVYDTDKKEKRCSDELIGFLNREVNRLKQSKIDVIKKVTEKLDKSNVDLNKAYKELKLIRNFGVFDNWLVDLNEQYKNDTGKKLYEVDEYLELSDYRNFSSIKNLILVSLI